MILLTGATGQVGAALLPRLLADPDAQVAALVRARDDAHLERRAEELSALAGPGADRLYVVRGDTTVAGLGVSPAERSELFAEVTSILHAAAAVRFDLPEEELVRQNVEATEAVLDFARSLHAHGQLRRFDYVSTAYVAGTRTGLCREDELDEGQDFRNGYERSKCAAEGRVRAAMARGLPATIHRPSIVVGDSHTGVTRSFNVLYWPLKVYLRGWWRTFPGHPETRVDVVPVDWLADAITFLRDDPASLGRTVHLCLGPTAPTVRDIEATIRRITGGPPLHYVDPDLYTRVIRPMLWPLFLSERGESIRRGGSVFLPYFKSNPIFDVTHRDALGVPVPPRVDDYLERVLRYAMERDFGRAGGEEPPPG